MKILLIFQGKRNPHDSERWGLRRYSFVTVLNVIYIVLIIVGYELLLLNV